MTRRQTVTRLALLVLVLAALAALYLVGSGEQDRPGNPAVYDQIEASTDCAALQETFDRAMGNHGRAEPGTEERRWTLAYAQAADDRMKKLDCYE